MTDKKTNKKTDGKTDKSEMSPPLIELENIVMRKQGRAVLNGLNCAFAPPGPCLLMGANGCGKTSLLRVLHGLDRAHHSQGRIRWHDKNLRARANQSFVFQSPVLMRRTVLDNIAYPQILRSMKRKDARALAQESANQLGLGEKGKMRAAHLSGGERQKTALARALITKPALLLLDEPTANLDGRSTREIESLLLKVSREGTFVIMASHDRDQARRIAASLAIMSHGRVIEQGAAERMLNRASAPAARAYFQGELVD